RAPPATAARLLECLRQVGHDFLSGGEFLRDGLLRGREFPAQLILHAAAAVFVADPRRRRLRSIQTEAQRPPGDVDRTDRRIFEAAGQPLAWGQAGLGLRTHRAPLSRPERNRYQPAINRTAVVPVERGSRRG